MGKKEKFNIKEELKKKQNQRNLLLGDICVEFIRKKEKEEL